MRFYCNIGMGEAGLWSCVGVATLLGMGEVGCVGVAALLGGSLRAWGRPGLWSCVGVAVIIRGQS